MAFDRDEFGRQVQVHAKRLQAVGVALLVLGASYWIGKQSRTHVAPLTKQLSDLRATNDKLIQWERGFRGPDSAEAAQIRMDTASVHLIAVPAGSRMQVAQLVARQADQAGLSQVQLSFSPPPDSGDVPPRGRVGDIPISVATHVVNVECTGSFAAAMKFVSHLPPSLTITRLGVHTEPAGAKYRLVLSVYEVPRGRG